LIDNNGLASTDDRGGWRKSSYSNSAAQSCVEISHGFDAVFVRDSKDRRTGQPIIGMPTGGWKALLKTIADSAR
jgi:Domain of unknown function (DUF397)